ncbi:CoA transferase [Aeromicrobium sp. Sec7.5]|uniref:CoA transferase n=1 Tax=Aeromicrobium sp. Sec7.5 TaxID=3121276 RepID=UPI002FE4EADF
MGRGEVSAVDTEVLRGLRHAASVGPDQALADWLATGLAGDPTRSSTTGWTAHGRPATLARALATTLTSVAAERFDTALPLDGAELLGRRARLSAIDPEGAHGPDARLLRAADGWWSLNLARPSDVELVPALVEDQVDAAWTDVEGWSARLPAQAVVDRATMLGLPASRLGETPVPAEPWRTSSAPASTSSTSLRVVNLGSLWAAPLAAHLLGRLGAEVVHVESTTRPDASRWGSPAFYDELRVGAEVRSIDVTTTSGRAALHALVSSADVVVEASRPRALEGLGVGPGQVMPDGRARTWLQITGHGPEQPHRVGFGDDAAVAGGLVVVDRDGLPGFYGDAVADPLTGLVGALAVAANHDQQRQTVMQASLAWSAATARAAGDVSG